MTDGPFDYVLIKFSDGRLGAEVVPALIDLVGYGAVRILDLVLINKDPQGAVRSMEIDELDDAARELFYDLDGEYGGLLSDADIAVAGQDLAPGDAAVAIIWEDVWAATFAESIRRDDGEVVVSDRLPSVAVLRALNELATAR